MAKINEKIKYYRKFNNLTRGDLAHMVNDTAINIKSICFVMSFSILNFLENFVCKKIRDILNIRMLPYIIFFRIFFWPPCRHIIMHIMIILQPISMICSSGEACCRDSVGEEFCAKFISIGRIDNRK